MLLHLWDDYRIDWPWTFYITFLHFSSIYGFYFIITGKTLFQTLIWINLLHHISGIGVVVGAHRYWSHRSFKAKLPLRLILAFAQTMSGQKPLFYWVKDHRLHHKYSDTDADPHNVNRGFLFAQLLWLIFKPHPKYIEKGF